MPRSEPAPQPTGRSAETQLQRWGNRRTETQDSLASPLQSARPAQPARAAVPRVRSAPLTSPSTTVVDADSVRSNQRVAEPRRYPNPENATTRVAVPRGSVPSVDPQPSGGGAIVYDRGARVYHNYYYYSRNSYPYGYGSYGLGYFYYDPYGWYDPYPVYYPGPTYTGGYYDPRYGYGTGEIRLQVRPRDADVYVDGFYAGRVDEFDGFVQSLRIEEGPHTIEIVAPGYEPLVFSVRIVAGRKINYRRDLIPYRR